MILEIPDELREAFLTFLEVSVSETILDFGSDLSEEELQLVELLSQFTESSREKQSATQE